MFSLKSCSCIFLYIIHQNNTQKPLQNEVRTMQKSMSKTCRFSTSILFRFWPAFWSLLGFQLGAKLIFWLQKPEDGVLQEGGIFVVPSLPGAQEA